MSTEIRGGFCSFYSPETKACNWTELRALERPPTLAKSFPESGGKKRCLAGEFLPDKILEKQKSCSQYCPRRPPPPTVEFFISPKKQPTVKA